MLNALLVLKSLISLQAYIIWRKAMRGSTKFKPTYSNLEPIQEGGSLEESEEKDERMTEAGTQLS